MVKVKKAPINRAEQIEKTLEQTKTIAKQLLKEIGIKIHILGFYYWLTTLMIIKENEMKQEEKMPMMELYKLVAIKHKTTGERVERAMRYAYLELDLKQQFNVDYPVNNTALLFLLKEEIDKRMCNTLRI